MHVTSVSRHRTASESVHAALQAEITQHPAPMARFASLRDSSRPLALPSCLGYGGSEGVYDRMTMRARGLASRLILNHDHRRNLSRISTSCRDPQICEQRGGQDVAVSVVASLYLCDHGPASRGVPGSKSSPGFLPSTGAPVPRLLILALQLCPQLEASRLVPASSLCVSQVLKLCTGQDGSHVSHSCYGAWA